MTPDERNDLSARVAIDSAWLVWGDHYRAIAERESSTLVDGEHEREVLLIPCRVGVKTPAQWVAAWRVAKYGVVSEAFMATKAGAS